MENQDQLELIRAMAEKLDRMEKRQRAARGWKLVIWLCVLTILGAVAIYFGPRVVAGVQRYATAVERIETISEELGEVDLNGVKETLKYLETVDFDKLKEKTNEASKLLDKLSKMDFDELNKVLEDFNESMAPLLKMFS